MVSDVSDEHKSKEWKLITRTQAARQPPLCVFGCQSASALSPLHFNPILLLSIFVIWWRFVPTHYWTLSRRTSGGGGARTTVSLVLIVKRHQRRKSLPSWFVFLLHICAKHQTQSHILIIMRNHWNGPAQWNRQKRHISRLFKLIFLLKLWQSHWTIARDRDWLWAPYRGGRFCGTRDGLPLDTRCSIARCVCSEVNAILDSVRNM